MRKWWNDIRCFGRYLLGRLKEEEEERENFHTRPLNDAGLKEQAGHQKTVYEAIFWYGRRKARREISNIHRRLIADKPESVLARQIRQLFPGKNL